MYTLVIFLTCLIACCHSQFVGPANFFIERIEKCADDTMGVKLELGMKKFNRTSFGISADVVFPFAWDETVQFNFTAEKWGDGGWKPSALDLYEKNACTALMKYCEKKLKQIFEVIKHPDNCPLRAGNYIVRDYAIGNDIEVPLPYGYFKVSLRVLKNDEMFTCLRGYIKTEKKLLG